MENHTNRSLPVIGSIAVTALLVGGFVLWLQATTLDNLQQQIEGLRVSNEAATSPSEKTKSTVEVLSIDAHILAEVPTNFNVITAGGRTIISEGVAPRVLGGEFTPPLIALSGYENPKKLSVGVFARENSSELGVFDKDLNFKKVSMVDADGVLIEGVEFKTNGVYDARMLLFPVSETQIAAIELGYLDFDSNNEMIKVLDAIRETMRIVQ